MKAKYLLLTLPIFFIGCKNEYEYDPAKVQGTTMGVCFDSSNESDFIVDPGEDFDGVNITILRGDASADAVVPLEIVTRDECFTDVPASVHFAAGEKSVTINLPVSKDLMPEYIKQHVSIRIPKEYADYYVNSGNAPVYSASIVLTKWIRITRLMRQYSENQCDIYTSVYWLKGQNQFIIKNFCQSGRDLKFKIVAQSFDPNDRSTWKGILYPLENYELRWNSTNNGYTSFYFVDENGEHISWTTDKKFTYETVANFELQADYNEVNFTYNYNGARSLFLYKYQSPTGGTSSSCYVYWYNNDTWNTEDGYETANNHDDLIYTPDEEDEK